MSSNTTGVEPLPTPGTPPRPGSARERMRKETAKNWEGTDATPPKPTPEPPAPKPATPETPPKPGEKPPATPDPDTQPPSDLTAEQKKQNPWKLYRQEKERASKLETELTTVKSKGVSDTERTELTERLTKAEEKLKGYEDELRFRAYEKSDEYRTKYEVPYEKAWNKHAKDLSEVPVQAEDGSQHLAKAEDILELVNASLPEARKIATAKWGDFANEAMMARKEIRDLFEAKSTALEEARKNGADREKQFQANAKAWRDKVQKQIADTWKAANERAQNDPKNSEFFKPVEGDDPESIHRNEVLRHGYEQVDRAFSLNPMDPKLTDEERIKAVTAHAVVRNRSAAYGVQKLIIARLRKSEAEKDKIIAELKGSAPPSGGTAPAAPAGSAPGRARDRMHAAGDKYAR